jgi:hypothetical protein
MFKDTGLTVFPRDGDTPRVQIDIESYHEDGDSVVMYAEYEFNESGDLLVITDAGNVSMRITYADFVKDVTEEEYKMIRRLVNDNGCEWDNGIIFNKFDLQSLIFPGDIRAWVHQLLITIHKVSAITYFRP